VFWYLAPQSFSHGQYLTQNRCEKVSTSAGRVEYIETVHFLKQGLRDIRISLRKLLYKIEQVVVLFGFSLPPPPFISENLFEPLE